MKNHVIKELISGKITLWGEFARILNELRQRQSECQLNEKEQKAISILGKKREEFFGGHQYDYAKDSRLMDKSKMEQQFMNLHKKYHSNVSGLINSMFGDKIKAMKVFIVDWYNMYTQWKNVFLQTQTRFPISPTSQATIDQAAHEIENVYRRDIDNINESIKQKFIRSLNDNSFEQEMLNCTIHGIDSHSSVFAFFVCV